MFGFFFVVCHTGLLDRANKHTHTHTHKMTEKLEHENIFCLVWKEDGEGLSESRFNPVLENYVL